MSKYTNGMKMGGRHSKRQQNKLISELREAFEMFDKNNDGEITRDELGKVMKFMGFNPTDEELNMLIIRADIDGNGGINFNEFVAVMTDNAQKIIEEEEEIRHMFKTFDKRHKGCISPQDIKVVMSELGEELTDEEIDSMILEVDPNRSGMIDLDKFKIMVKKFMYP